MSISRLMQMGAAGAGGEAPPEVIGQEYGGGFYAGNIVEGGVEYYLVVAPKSSGETVKQFKTSADGAPTATRTLNNGPAASASMNSATYPAAQFCEALSINGFTDWYLPSRDELELFYRNLKPHTDSNATNNREKSAYTYPEGNDIASDTWGVNRNSSPTGPAYTSGSPSQTSAVVFKAGGSEALVFANGTFYWSSSEFSASASWSQTFQYGGQFGTTKTASYYVRAVRRVPV